MQHVREFLAPVPIAGRWSVAPHPPQRTEHGGFPNATNTVNIKIAIDKKWKSKNSAEPFTNSQFKGLAGQTVDYEIVITNTGTCRSRSDR